MENWISTKERLPEADEAKVVCLDGITCAMSDIVLICTYEGMMVLAQYSFDDMKWITDDSRLSVPWFSLDEVLFWQPLPDIPDSVRKCEV